MVRYLNTAYFGAGVYGVDAAARRYFGKRANGNIPSAPAVTLGGTTCREQTQQSGCAATSLFDHLVGAGIADE